MRIPTYLSTPQLHNFFSPILVYIRDQFYKTIILLISPSVSYYSTYGTSPDLLFFSLHHHTTLHTHHFQIEINFTKLFSGLSLLLSHITLHTVPLPISYFSLFIPNPNPNPYFSTYAPLPNLIDLYSHCSSTLYL